MRKPDYLRAAITDLLVPDMVQRGFVRVKPKFFARIRGDLVGGLSFQVSRWGSKTFYVHTWILPKCSPPRDSYLVGTRHDYDGVGAVDWIADTKENAQLALTSLRHYYIDTIEPWFQSMPTLQEFVTAYLKVPQRRRKSAEYLAMMLALGRVEEYEALLLEIDERQEPQSFELVELRAAYNQGRSQELLNKWRSENESPLSALGRGRG